MLAQMLYEMSPEDFSKVIAVIVVFVVTAYIGKMIQSILWRGPRH